MGKNSYRLITILSPKFSASIMTIMGLCFLAIPPKIYASNLPEKIYYWMNFKASFLIIASYMFFMAGSFLMSRVKILTRIAPPKNLNYPLYGILFWLSIALFLELLTTSQLFLSIGFADILGQDSHALRIAVGRFNSDTKSAWVDMFAITISLLCLWRILFINEHKTKLAKLIIIAVISTVVLLIFAKATIAQIRGPIITTILELFAVVSLSQIIKKKISFKVMSYRLLSLSAIFILIFGILQVKRVGGNLFDSLISGLFGYFPASYNRMAAIINGDLTLPNSQSTFLTFNWLWEFPLISNILNFTDLGREIGLNLPKSGLIYQNDSFLAVGGANLINGLIWPTIYGGLFGDLGWVSLVWFFFYGIFAEAFWKEFKKLSNLGIMIYPRVFASGLAWYATPDIARREVTVVILSALLFNFSEYIIYNRFKNKPYNFKIERSV